jgi:hypothetical protein
MFDLFHTEAAWYNRLELKLLLPSPLQILSQSNIHQFPLLPRFAIRFNQPLREFLDFYIRGALSFEQLINPFHSNFSIRRQFSKRPIAVTQRFFNQRCDRYTTSPTSSLSLLEVAFLVVAESYLLPLLPP